MELLDDVKVEVRKKPVFSWLAIALPLGLVFMLVYIGSLMEDQKEVVYEDLFFSLIVAFFIFGILSAFFSFIRKEEPKVLKWIGGLFNGLILLGIFLFLLIYGL